MVDQPKTWREMSVPGQAFFSLIVAAGLGVLVYAALHWSSQEPRQAGCYLLLAILASRTKVKLPGIATATSASFLVILPAIVELGLPEALVIGCAAALVQLFHKVRPGFVEIAFNVGATAVAVTITGRAYELLVYHSRPASSVLSLVGVAATYLIASTIPVAIIISLNDNESLTHAWSERYLWMFPYYLLGTGLGATSKWLDSEVSWLVSVLLLLVVYLVYRSYGLYLGRLEVEESHAEQMANLHLRTIEVLALAIEAKDQNTHAHLQRVGIYAMEIAKELKVSPEELKALQAAALLHDIGKLAVPEHIVSKPGRLTPEEFERMKIHPVVGAELLEKVEFPYPVVPIVRAHHEKWDGSGYPYGLKKEEIPIGARILSAVDFLDALASDRQYRRALPLDEVLNKLSAESEKSFDPQVVKVLLRRSKQLEKLVQKSASKKPQVQLPSDTRIGEAAAPASGFERSSQSKRPPMSEATFLDSVAAAKQEVQILFEMSQQLGTSLSLDDTLSVFASKVRRLIPYDSIVIYVRNDDVLIPKHVSGENFRVFSGLRIPLGEGVSGWVAENKKPMLNGNPNVEPGYMNEPGKFATLSSALSVPLEGLDGVAGVVTLYAADRDAFATDHLRILLAVSSKMALAIENALKYEQAESSATTDYLTGLPNARSMFLQLGRDLARAKRRKSSLTVMVCDLDGFKQVNDRFGHLEGNRVLQLFAKRLKERSREYDYVARLGGDEFVVIVPDLPPESENAKINQLREMARQAGNEICGEDLLSVSVGKAIYPDDAEDMDKLLAEADRRMYAEKQHRSGKKNLRAYPRLSCCVTVELEHAGSETPVIGKLANISSGGCYVETGEILASTTKLVLTFSGDDGGRLLIGGTVVRNNLGTGFGVKFRDVSPEDRERVKRILGVVEGELTAAHSGQEYLKGLGSRTIAATRGFLGALTGQSKG
ncbi:MAG: diguanylate cyclase [Acidobacteriales bacterium]|nr:diguanylate cyclase [Terriglobales bacterium]